MAYTFSPSSLSILAECPRCFWLHFKKAIKRPSGIFPSLPGGMDQKLKLYFDSYRAIGELPPELSRLKGARLFQDKEKLKVWRNNFKGIQWTDGHGNVFRGAVDELLEKDGILIVLDFKTRGYPLKEDTAAYYANQLDIYNLLLQKNRFRTATKSFLLFYYPQKVQTGGEVRFSTELVGLPVSVSNAQIIFDRAVEVLAGPLPKPTDSCPYCAWLERVKAVEQ
jgi:hypothetical protein